MARTKKAGDGVGKPAPSTLPTDQQRILAHEKALRLLGVRERSASELRQRLRQKGFDRDVIEGVLERLRETGLQDDSRFAEHYASEATTTRGFASRRVRGELMRKGISRDLAAVASTTDPDQEEERARALAVQRAARMGSLGAEARARRILSLLARRGYDADICRRIAAEVASFEREAP
ncbi:MAG: regulatory protein RecX [Actinomycetota bacterium]